MATRPLLVFGLSGPLAAFGSPAVGERRPVDDRPTRSGVLGIVAACLGIDRSDEQALMALSEDTSVAVRSDRVGRLLLDFHTVEAPRLGKVPFSTRREELAASKTTTVISYREYRSEAEATVVISASGDRVPNVEAMADALRRPVFAPYLGRRSCPVGEPFWPLVVEAETIEGALEAYDAAKSAAWAEAELHEPSGRKDRSGAIGSDVGMGRKANAGVSQRRRDQLVSARKRHLGLREEIVDSWFGDAK